MSRVVPLVVYKDGVKEVVGEAVVEDNGYGSFTIFVGPISNVVAIETDMSFGLRLREGI